MSSYIILIFTLSAIVAISPFVSKITKLPTTVIEVVCGMIGVHFGFIHKDLFFEIIAEFSFLYLMFLAGLEINTKELLQMPKSQVRDSFLYLFFIYSLSVIAYLVFDLSAIFILIFSLISIGVVMTLTKEFNKCESWLNLGLRVGIIGELVSIFLLTISTGLLKYGLSADFFMTIFYLSVTILSLIVFFYISKVSFWWFPELKTYFMPSIDSKEQDIRLSMSLLFIFISFMLMFDLELVLGAFFAGLFISSFFYHKKELPIKLSSFGFGFLIPLFFIHIGSSLDVNLLFDIQIVKKVILITTIMILIRVFSSFVFLKYMTLRDTFLFALSHSMPLTLMIAIATLAYHEKSIDKLNYSAFILSSIVEVIISIVFIRLVKGVKH